MYIGGSVPLWLVQPWLDDFISKALSKLCQATNGGERASDIQVLIFTNNFTRRVGRCFDKRGLYSGG